MTDKISESKDNWRVWIIPFFVTLMCMSALQMSNFGFSPLLPSIQKEFSLTFTQLGLFTGIGGLVVTLASLPGGAIVQRYGERNMMVAGAAIVGIGMIAIALASSFYGALAGRIIWQAAYRVTFICITTGIAMTTPPHLRGVTMGIMGSCACIGIAFGAPLGGAIEQSFGWRGSFFTYSAIGFVVACVFWLLYRRTQTPAGGIHGHGAAVAADPNAPKPKSAFKTPVVWALAALMFVGAMTSLTVVFFVPSVLKGTYKLTTLEASYVISTGYMLGIFTNVLVGWLSDRFNRWNVLASVAAIQAVCALAMTGNDFTSFRIATVIVLALGLCIPNQVYALGGLILKGRDVGACMGVVGFGSGCAAYFGPQILGILRDVTGGFTAGWYFLSGVAVVVIIEVFLLRMYSSTARDVVTANTRKM